jgi:hypothetical protein
MKKSVMKKWVKALRSGEYTQAKGVLVDSQDNFCCLGVLCNLAPDSVRGEWEVDQDGDYYMFEEITILPQKIMDWSGVQSPVGRTNDFDLILSTENDNGKPFNEIADLIEDNYKKL